MTPAGFRAWLERRRLTQAQAAALLGSDQSAVSRWSTGERKVPGPVAKLVAALDELDALRSPEARSEWWQQGYADARAGRDPLPDTLPPEYIDGYEAGGRPEAR